MSYFVDETELYHHGILGQKWGVRRYQKKDGSLTRLGKKHWEMLDDDTVNRERNKAINTGDLKTIKKHRDRFSADEINRAITNKNASDKLKYEMSKKGKKEKKEAEKEAKAMAEAKKNAEKLNNLANKVGSISNALSKGSDAYNSFAKASNSLFGTSFKLIKEKQEKEPTKWSMDKLMNTRLENMTVDQLQEYAKATASAKTILGFKDEHLQTPKKEKTYTVDEVMTKPLDGMTADEISKLKSVQSDINSIQKIRQEAFSGSEDSSKSESKKESSKKETKKETVKEEPKKESVKENTSYEKIANTTLSNINKDTVSSGKNRVTYSITEIGAMSLSEAEKEKERNKDFWEPWTVDTYRLKGY